MKYKNYEELNNAVELTIHDYKNKTHPGLETTTRLAFAKTNISKEEMEFIKNETSNAFSSFSINEYISIKPDLQSINKYMTYEDQIPRLLYYFTNYHPLKVIPNLFKLINENAKQFGFTEHTDNLCFMLNHFMFNYKFYSDYKKNQIIHEGVDYKRDSGAYIEFYHRVTRNGQFIEDNTECITINYKYQNDNGNVVSDSLEINSKTAKALMLIDFHDAILNRNQDRKNLDINEENQKLVKNRLKAMQFIAAGGLFNYITNEMKINEDTSKNDIYNFIGLLLQKVEIIEESYDGNVTALIKSWVKYSKSYM